MVESQPGVSTAETYPIRTDTGEDEEFAQAETADRNPKNTQ